MASFDESKLIEALEKSMFILPEKPDDTRNFLVKGCGIETTICVSSSFKAAVKMGYILLDLNLIDRVNNLKLCVEVCDEESNTYFYNVFLAGHSRRLLVELERVNMKETPSIYEGYDSNLQHIDRNISNITTDENTCYINGETATRELLIDQSLQRFFGFESFKPLQKETIMSTMKGQNVLTIVGTGGGKTLMYMLPAVLSSKPTVVLSPIKSLIEDLLLRCQHFNIPACKFTGEVPQHLQKDQLKNFSDFKLIFCTPEILEEGELLEKVQEQDSIERIVFDEAHTISTWGTTFRPVYKAVCNSLAKIACPLLLLSATVPLKLENDLHDIFGDVCVYRNSVFRENLFLEVVERGGKFYDDMASFIKERKEQCGIVYCVLPSDVAKMHAELLKRNINAVKYHGQLSEEVKTASFSRWMAGDVKVIVANSSFGMGIDKKDVRFILHARIVTSVDEYFQQCGRGGRDGAPATCRLYYSHSDKSNLYKLFYKQDVNFVSQCSAVNDLIAILENPVHCRHNQIMAYFGDVRDSFVCLTGCDNCKNRGSMHVTDGTCDALNVVRAVVELTGKNITCNTLKLFLAGRRQKSILADELDSYANFGVLAKKFSPIGLLDVFLNILINNDILAEKFEKKGKGFSIYVTLGKRAHDLLALNTSVIKYQI